MPNVLILVDSDQAQPSGFSAATQMIDALQIAIRDNQATSNTTALDQSSWQVEVRVATTLTPNQFSHEGLGDSLLCPLTLAVPEWLEFPAQSVYQACQDIEGLRQRVLQWQYKVGEGNGWLPIVLTGKGPLYGEVIGVKGAVPVGSDLNASHYFQPIHLVDVQRQALYGLAQRLLRSLAVPPAVYLLQFGFHGETLQFDRLIPFPAAPAIASINLQEPDLFDCHWRCLTNQPILDLTISAV
ncbi:hypothetical protein JOY44_18660 [Phormidium sp. CLA17]|uniref:hypothetical protein n=1 Tax=Leptolyngbya sp. Cla-17 TaxID=2803751 RepID=UPI0014921310|nr:hypothetical protein [Leptolyngbya sp. Cla-17]MBM0743611.1 hypothetical protein [Leptolyngbya sp. Cla-17]